MTITSVPTSATKGPSRIYRACIHCRQRKSKCELYERLVQTCIRSLLTICAYDRDAVGQPGVPPCRRCIREQRECILAGSRRGGRRPKKPKAQTESSIPSVSEPMCKQEQRETSSATADVDEEFSPAWSSPWNGAQRDNVMAYQHYSPTNNNGHSVEKTIASADIQTSSDALEILAQVAGDAQVDKSATAPVKVNGADPRHFSAPELHMRNEKALASFPPLATGSMSVAMVHNLFAR